MTGQVVMSLALSSRFSRLLPAAAGLAELVLQQLDATGASTTGAACAGVLLQQLDVVWVSFVMG
jgi:hypothetical protein